MAGKATAVLVEINGNLTPGSWLITPTSWLADCLEIGISSKFYHQLQVWDWLFLHLPYCHVCYYTFIGRCAGSFSSVGRRSMNSFTWSCANTSTSQKTSYAMHCMETTSVVCHIDDVIRCDLSVFLTSAVEVVNWWYSYHLIPSFVRRVLVTAPAFTVRLCILVYRPATHQIYNDLRSTN